VSKNKLSKDLQETVQSLSRAIDVYEWGRGLAHDMRGPLSAVIGYLDLIRRRFGDVSPRQVLRYAEFAHEAALRVNQMVEDIMDVISHENRGGMVIQCQELDLQEFFGRLSRMFNGMAEEKHVRLVCRVEGESAPSVWADPKYLERVFDNLLVNALKFTPAGGCVSLLARWTPERYVFQVADTGRGIPLESLKRIFEPFQQAIPADRACGHGLGLTLAKCMIRAHQGDIDVESRMGVGSRFTFWIPHRPGTRASRPVLNNMLGADQMPLFDEADLAPTAVN
jgi:signal transduction histidine kinase